MSTWYRCLLVLLVLAVLLVIAAVVADHHARQRWLHSAPCHQARAEDVQRHPERYPLMQLRDEPTSSGWYMRLE